MPTFKIGVEASSTHTVEADDWREAERIAKGESAIPGHLVARTLVLEENYDE